MEIIAAGQAMLLDHDVNYTESVEINGTLVLDPSKNINIVTNSNIIVAGKLISHPNLDVVHTIRLIGIDENKFVGNSDTVLNTDVGIWVMGAGQLDLQGAVQNDWKRLGSDYGAMEKFAQAVGSNMCIEGTPAGYSHLFIKSSNPQSIRFVQFKFMGPRKDMNGDGIKEFVTGRYACHFHHSGNGSRGSIVEGCIARDCNSHCFVPHGSHGITMRSNIVYNVLESPFWYDFNHKTDDLIWENNLVVKVGYIPRAMDQDSEGSPQGGAGAFVLGFGDSNVCRGNVVIETSGDARAAGAYIWPELRDDNDISKDLTSTWIFEDNTAISCPSGIMVWQNSDHHHIIKNFTAIGCEIAIIHGAYGNHYRYLGGKIKGGHIEIFAASGTTNRVRFEEMDIDADGGDYCIIVNECPGNGVVPVLIRACKFSNWVKHAIIDQNPGPGLKNVDVVDCKLLPANIKVTATKTGETVRLQEGDNAWKITKSGTTTIAKFAPSLWGNGIGLLAEYFSPDFATKYLERIEPNPNIFDITHPQIHYAVPASYAVRWTGKMQPQFTESYTFYVTAGGGVRLWIDNKLIIDKWAERYPGDIKVLFGSMVANKLYDVKLEYFNTDDRSKCLLEWSSLSLKRELIPMSQLYPSSVTPPEPPSNKPPVVNAGDDQIVEIVTVLNGTAIDSDGSIASVKWNQVSGSPAIIVTPDNLTTYVKGLSKGESIFQLTVTDNKGAIANDEVRVTVQ